MMGDPRPPPRCSRNMDLLRRSVRALHVSAPPTGRHLKSWPPHSIVRDLGLPPPVVYIASRRASAKETTGLLTY